MLSSYGESYTQQFKKKQHFKREKYSQRMFRALLSWWPFVVRWRILIFACGTFTWLDGNKDDRFVTVCDAAICSAPTFLVCLRWIQIDISARYTTIASYIANIYFVDYPHARNQVGESTHRSSTKFVEISKWRRSQDAGDLEAQTLFELYGRFIAEDHYFNTKWRLTRAFTYRNAGDRELHR